MSKPEDSAKEDDDDAHFDITPVSDPKQIKTSLYARCAIEGVDKVFSQEDLLSFQIIPNNDLNQLLSCTQKLTKEGLLKLMSKDGRAHWKVVKREDAAKYKSLNAEEAMIYSYIESSGREGTWIRLLRARTNLHMTVMKRCLKSLEAKNYIKPIKSIKFPGRKTYMLAHLQPFEDVTGGPFYTDGNLDEEFVHQMSYWTEKYVVGRSWRRLSAIDTGKKKNKAKSVVKQAENVYAQDSDKLAPERQRGQSMLPMPPGYTGYPTVPEITKAMNASGLSGVVMKEAEMKQLLDVLCFDGRLQEIHIGGGYRAVRQYDESGDDMDRDGLTGAPCGRCPVADVCDENGPVNARTCVYFQEWLEM